MYFFTDPAKLLTPQTPAQAYGPVQGEEQTKYRVTSKFQASNDAPAVAALGGVVLVQPNASNPNQLCNLVIKVSDTDDSRTQFDSVDYVIYRGILRSSFLTAATIPTLAPAAATNTDLVASIWDAYTKAQFDAQQLLLSFTFLAPTADWLGFNRTDPTQTLEAAFADTTRLAPLAPVKAGMSLGTFSNTAEAGIEFIVFDRFYRPTIDDLRKSEMLFTVPLSSGSIPGHDANYADQRTRENILNYIDPAAYYTMHYRNGVRYKDSSGTTYRCATVETIGSQLLNAFVPSQNRLYLDIRNELGGSLNFYRDNEGTGADQGIHIQYGYDKNAPLIPKNYYTNNWPIFSKVINPAIVTATTIVLKVRQAHNPQPLLFLDYGYTTIGASTEKLKPVERFTDVTQVNATDWSQLMELKLLSPSTATAHPIWFIKVMCIRQIVPANIAATVPSAPPRRYALDHIFGPFRADMLTTDTNTNSVLPGKKYMAGSDGGAIVQLRKIQEATEVTFQAERLFAFGTYSLLPFISTALWPNRFFDNSTDTKWLMQPGIITKQANLSTNGIPLTMLRQSSSLNGGATAAPAFSLTLKVQHGGGLI